MGEGNRISDGKRVRRRGSIKVKLPRLKSILLLIVILASIPIGGITYLAARDAYRDRQIRKTCRIGERVLVPALFAYHEKQGVYPATLDDLTPTYLNQIPRPTTGDGKWLYSRLENGEYEFGFKDANDERHPSAFYSSGRDEWDIDTR